MNNYQKNEIIGREKFEKILKSAKVKNWEFQENQYSVYDCKYWTETSEYIVEIKTRNWEHTKYEGWILEEMKYNSLIELCDTNTTALYVNFFNDGYWCIWNLNNLENIQIKKKGCKRATVEYKGYTNKSVIELSIESATYFGRIDNDTVTILNYEREERKEFNS